MKARLFIGGLEQSAFEQDVRVTVVSERDVKLQPGDEVHVLVIAEVDRVIYEADPPEVSLVRPRAQKVLHVKRRERR